MLLASLAIAFLAGPQAAPPPAADGATKVWDNLDVMRRMLVRQIGAKRDLISAAPKPADDGEVVTTKDGKVLSVTRGGGANGSAGTTAPLDNLPEKLDDSVAGNFMRTRYTNWFENSIGSEAEYVPGLAAIFSVNVPVKVRIVTLDAVPPDVKKPSETKNADDEAWEKVARGTDDPVDRHVKSLLGQGGKGQDEPRRELKFDDAAVKALKETVADTVARFGSRVGLGHGERLAVVIKLQAGSVVGDGDEKPDEKRGEVIPDEPVNRFDTFGNPGVIRDGRIYSTFTGNNNVTIAARRFVLQVSADDLRAFKAGELERDELFRKMRIEEFVVPNGTVIVGNPFGWSNSPANRR
jgi:hypothetical protein